MSKIDGVIESLIRDETLPFQLRDHNLYGNYRGRRSCHIEPDWILIYKIDGNEIIFERTGSHSNLY
ncbi:MAG: type II toxin-antitoxin system YafQ family toxin [Oscillospiraceae bacterium]|nr:type II toxin-antitoxin system YafQ family toxin [Oscillospiraceae bacterium]